MASQQKPEFRKRPRVGRAGWTNIIMDSVLSARAVSKYRCCSHSACNIWSGMWCTTCGEIADAKTK
eukprot:2947137-Rhodomonas_salina.1